jgi:hypothetical protein
VPTSVSLLARMYDEAAPAATGIPPSVHAEGWGLRGGFTCGAINQPPPPPHSLLADPAPQQMRSFFITRVHLEEAGESAVAKATAHTLHSHPPVCVCARPHLLHAADLFICLADAFDKTRPQCQVQAETQFGRNMLAEYGALSPRISDVMKRVAEKYGGDARIRPLET